MLSSINAASSLVQKRSRSQGFVSALAKAFELDPQLRAIPSAETIVCRCEDVSFQTLGGYNSARDAKLHTRCGMGPCQGRICGAATQFLFGWGADSVRPPVLTASFSSLAAASCAAGHDSNDILNQNRKDTHTL